MPVLPRGRRMDWMTSPSLIQAQRLGAPCHQGSLPCRFPKVSIRQGKACGGSHLKEPGTSHPGPDLWGSVSNSRPVWQGISSPSSLSTALAAPEAHLRGLESRAWLPSEPLGCWATRGPPEPGNLHFFHPLQGILFKTPWSEKLDTYWLKVLPLQVMNCCFFLSQSIYFSKQSGYYLPF